ARQRRRLHALAHDGALAAGVPYFDALDLHDGRTLGRVADLGGGVRLGLVLAVAAQDLARLRERGLVFVRVVRHGLSRPTRAAPPSFLSTPSEANRGGSFRVSRPARSLPA